MIRTIHISVGLCYCLFFLLLAVNNSLDYEGFFTTIRTIMSMSDLPTDNPIHYRAVDLSSLHHFVSLSVILAQYCLSFLFGRGVVVLFKGRWEINDVYHQLKGEIVLAHGMAFLFWFGFFVLIAGEWFQSVKNAETTNAMLFAISNLLSISILYLADEEKNEKVRNIDLIS